MTEATTPAPNRPRMSTGGRVALTIGIVVVALLVVGAVVTAVLLGTGRSTVEASASAEAGTSVDIRIPNGTIVLVPADDQTVSVEVQGRYLFDEPEVTVETNGGVTLVDGGCPSIGPWTAACSITVTIAMPPALPVTVAGLNGDVTVTDLTGDLSIGTTNGRVAVDGSAGALELSTTNGSVELTDSESARVAASTVNGEISLRFAASPDEVRASGTNGSITIELPDADEAYAIDLATVNGDTDLVKVVNDPQADRTIVAHTVNGSVTVRAD